MCKTPKNGSSIGKTVKKRKSHSVKNAFLKKCVYMGIWLGFEKTQKTGRIEVAGKLNQG